MQTHKLPYMHLFTRIILVTLFLCCIWIFFAPINSSIIATGEIIISSEKKLVQHLEGGIIKEIKVQEGDYVEKNQTLITLDTTQIEMQISQTNEEIQGLEFQKEANLKLLQTLKQEIALVNKLLKSRNASLTRKLTIQKKLYEVEANIGSLTTDIARLRSKNYINEDILKRSIIVAPVTGFVMDLKKHTTGGVISPAEEIMYIVPKNAHLIAEVKVKPQDVDLLEVGLNAKVQLSAYKTRLMPKLNANVVSFSADSFKNESTREVYFNARIEIPKEEISKLKEDIKLTAGMPVEVFIITGNRTMWEYLVAPIKESAYKAFREL